MWTNRLQKDKCYTNAVINHNLICSMNLKQEISDAHNMKQGGI